MSQSEINVAEKLHLRSQDLLLYSATNGPYLSGYVFGDMNSLPGHRNVSYMAINEIAKPNTIVCKEAMGNSDWIGHSNQTIVKQFKIQVRL